MIFSIIEILILIIIVGGGAVVLGLILFAVAKGRPGLAALVGALAILPVLAIVAVGALILYRAFGSYACDRDHVASLVWRACRTLNPVLR